MTTQDLWTAVDSYINDVTVAQDDALEAASAAAIAAQLPPISVTPAYGKLLHLLARALGATRVLEIGTLAGYSTIWFARALPADGRLITLEYDPKHADVARANLERAGLSSKVDIRVGKALDSLPQLATEKKGPFDLFFIDADKQNIPTYFESALKLSRPGTVIVVDNVVRDGAVVDAESTDASVQGVRRFVEQLAADSRASGTAIQTVGLKGYDGFAVVLVN
jgi:predicted O-methyltransferase YrrM